MPGFRAINRPRHSESPKNLKRRSHSRVSNIESVPKTSPCWSADTHHEPTTSTVQRLRSGSTDSHVQHHYPGLVALSAPVADVRQAQQDSSSSDALSYCDREWTVAGLVDKRLQVGSSESEYLVHWQSQPIRTKDIRTANDGSPCLPIGSHEHRIRKATKIPGTSLSQVRWEKTWVPRSDLMETAAGALAAFDKRAKTVQGSEIPHGGHKSFWPVSGRDYTSAFIRLIEREKAKRPKSKWIPIAEETERRRQIVFLDRWSNRSVLFKRDGVFRATVIYGFGRSVTPCKECRAGNGPFAQCVIEDGFFNNACVNCTFQDQSTKCCHHRKIEPDPWPGAGRLRSRSSRLEPCHSNAVRMRTQSESIGLDIIGDDGQPYYSPKRIKQMENLYDTNRIELLTGEELRFLVKHTGRGTGKGPMAAASRDIDDQIVDSIERGSNCVSATPILRRRKTPARSSDSAISLVHGIVEISSDEDEPHRRQKRMRNTSPRLPCSIVYRDQTFARHQATIREVRYVLDRVDFQPAREWFSRRWDFWLEKQREEGREQRYEGQEEFISARYWEELNALVKLWCPPRDEES